MMKISRHKIAAVLLVSGWHTVKWDDNGSTYREELSAVDNTNDRAWWFGDDGFLYYCPLRQVLAVRLVTDGDHEGVERDCYDRA